MAAPRRSAAPAAPPPRRPSSAALLLALLASSLPRAAPKASFALPYRAWTSWDLSAVTGNAAYGREFLTEANVLAQSDALAASPLQRAWDAASLRTVLAVDSFWALDPTKEVDAYGRWTWNTTRFPSGAAAVAARARTNGQRLGLYLNPGVPVAAVNQATPVLNGPGGGACTAADIAWRPTAPGNTFWDTRRINFSHPCAQAFVDSQVLLLAAEGVGMLKLDAVSPGSDDATGIDNRADVAAFSDAISRLGVDLWLTISWRINATFAADFAPHANAWRTSDDVDCYCNVLSAWHAVRNRFTEAVPWLAWLPKGARGGGDGGGGGGFPDLDSLNVLQGDFDGLSADEKLASATLWALVGAPLYTGNDLVAAGGDSAGLALLTNAEVLAVNDAALPPSLTPASASGTADLQVWYSGGGAEPLTVALFNLGAAAADVELVFSDVGVASGATVCIRDLWLRLDLGCTGNASAPFRALPSHGARLLRLAVSAPAAAKPLAARLPACVPNSTWAGACVWPNLPPADCPFAQSADLVGVAFSGRFGSYKTSSADTWYPSPGSDGKLYTCFADGEVCASAAPAPPPPLPPGYVPLLWWWSPGAGDNVLSTEAFPPEAEEGAPYELVGTIGYGLVLAAGPELRLWRANNASREYFTTSGAADEQRAAAMNYSLVAGLGVELPAKAPAPDPRPLPPTSDVNWPRGEPAGWAPALLLFSAARGDHFSTPEAFLPDGYAQLRAQGFMNAQPPSAAASCATGSGVSLAQGYAVLSGADAFNLSISEVGLVPHRAFPNLTLSVPPPYGLYPSTSFVFGGAWVVGYYLLADPNGAGCSNWCHLGPFVAFGVSSTSNASASGWSLDGAPLWDATPPRGVFEPLSVSAPIRLGVPRFVDLGVDLQYAPDGDGRAYLLGKGCAQNDGVHCSFMTGDSAFLARTRAPFASLLAAGGGPNNASALARALNDARTFEYWAGEAAGGWAASLADAAPVFSWPTGVGGVTMTYNAPLRRFIVVVNLPGDRVHPTDCFFDTYVLESARITGPFALVAYMPSLGPQMYFQHISSASWSADGRTGALFSSGNWDGACATQGSNPPGERYGLVTTEFTLLLAA